MSTPSATRPPARPLRPSSDYAWFVAGVASWFGAWGLQSVLFSWLVVGELRARPEWVGLVQTASMLPNFAFLLVGGATADRLDPRRLLVVLHAAAALPVALLAAAVLADRLSLAGLFAFGATLGVAGAFALPARDALLSRVAGDDLLRAVTGMTATQFGAQAAGALLAGGARFAGAAALLGVQASVLALGALAAARIRAEREPRPAPPAPSLRELTEGVRAVARDPRLRGITVCLFAVGVLFVGPFLVTFPLLVRDHYGGAVSELSVLLALFPLGTITGSLWLRSRGLARRGRAALLALAFGAGVLGAIGAGLPFPALLAATLCWGLGASVFINAARTLYQEAAPAAQRGRVLAVFQLCFLGGGPLGALAAGFANAELGPLLTLRVFAAAMLLVVGAVWRATGTARLR